MTLYQYFEFGYKKKGIKQVVNQEYTVRVRLIVLDESAIKSYSEWSLDQFSNSWMNRDEEYIGMKVIKPDGREEVVTIDNLGCG